MKVGISYLYTKGGRQYTTEVSTEAKSQSEAKATFEKKFSGKFDRVIGTREIKKP